MSHAFSTLRGRIAISVVALAILTAVVGLAVFSAFSSTQSSSTNKFTAGTVALTTNGTGSVLFNMPNMKPGESASECVQVTYTGTLNAKVQMYGTESGELGQYLTSSIVRGTFPGEAPANNACTGFTADASGSELFSGKLNELPSSSSPLEDPGSWSTNSVHVYKITVALPENAPEAAEGKSAQAAFTWQSTNS
jgi:predicted ribosomally synthesized peptide with SipW-like signal peptide